jgi:hypothetical protein
MKNKEKIYDEEISPLIKKIVEICEKNDIPLFATFQYSDELFCSTHIFGDGKHPVFEHYDAIRQCAQHSSVNVDKYIFWLLKTSRGKKHSSLFLHRLGNPANGEIKREG